MGPAAHQMVVLAQQEALVAQRIVPGLCVWLAYLATMPVLLMRHVVVGRASQGSVLLTSSVVEPGGHLLQEELILTKEELNDFTQV